MKTKIILNFVFLILAFASLSAQLDSAEIPEQTDKEVGLKLGMIMSYSNNHNYKYDFAIGMYRDFLVNDRTFINASLLFSRSHFNLSEFRQPDFTSQNLIFSASINRYLNSKKDFYALGGLSVTRELSRSAPNISSYDNDQFSIFTGVGYDLNLGNRQFLKIEGLVRYGDNDGLSTGINLRYGF